MTQIDLDEYVPNYNRECENCGQSPVVEGQKDGQIVFRGTLCGPCTFGTSKALDPKWWNSDEEQQ
jgi:hypothetical protein